MFVDNQQESEATRASPGVEITPRFVLNWVLTLAAIAQVSVFSLWITEAIFTPKKALKQLVNSSAWKDYEQCVKQGQNCKSILLEELNNASP